MKKKPVTYPTYPYGLHSYSGKQIDRSGVGKEIADLDAAIELQEKEVDDSLNYEGYYGHYTNAASAKLADLRAARLNAIGRKLMSKR